MNVLLLDPTTPGQLLIVLKQGKARKAHVIPLPEDHSLSNIQALESVLRLEKIQLHKLDRFVLVAGPGRFSSVRNASVVGTILGWALQIPLYQMRRPRTATFSQEEYLVALDHQPVSPVQRFQPIYGQPPSITLPSKKRSSQQRKR